MASEGMDAPEINRTNKAERSCSKGIRRTTKKQNSITQLLQEISVKQNAQQKSSLAPGILLTYCTIETWSRQGW